MILRMEWKRGAGEGGKEKKWKKVERKVKEKI